MVEAATLATVAAVKASAINIVVVVVVVVVAVVAAVVVAEKECLMSSSMWLLAVIMGSRGSRKPRVKKVRRL